MRANLLASLALALAPISFGADLDVVVGDADVVRASRGTVKGYAVFSVDVKGSTYTRLDGLAPNGSMVGSYFDDLGVLHGLVVTGGSAKSFDIAGAVTTYALGINSAGDVVGRYDLPDGSMHAYLFTQGKAVEIVAPGGVNGTVAHAITPTKEVVGYYFDQNWDFHGFVVSNQGTPGPTAEPAGAMGSGAFAVNASGQIGGFYYYADGVFHGMLLTRGTVTTLDPPNTISTILWGMNSQGQAVGSYFTDALHGFLYNGGDCATNCVTIDVPSASGTRANSIDSQGNIVGYYEDAGGTHGFLMMRVSE